MPMKLGHSFRVLAVHQRDHWRRGFRVGQGFYDGEALRIGAEVHDGQIDIVQSEAEDIECVLRAIGLYLAACALAGKVVSAVSYQDNIPFHTIS